MLKQEMEKRTNTKLQSESLKPFGARKAKNLQWKYVFYEKDDHGTVPLPEIMTVCVLYSNPISGISEML